MAHEIALGRMYTTKELIKLVKQVDSGQLVEVVRCKDCKWWHEDDDVGYCDNPDGLDNYAKPTDFCSYGERKDGDGNG